MKKIMNAGIIFGALVLAGLPQAVRADDFMIDPVHSTCIFKINHLGMSDFYGRFDDVSGKMTIDAASPEKSSVELVIKTASVDTHEPKRDAHLSGPDFFNAKQFPAIVFKSTVVKKIGEKDYEVSGNLTIKGVTKPVTLKVKEGGSGTDPWGKSRIGFNTETTLKRSDYGVNFMADKVGDEVTLMLSAEGVKS